MIFSIVHNKISLLIFVVSIANSEGDYTTPSFEALTNKHDYNKIIQGL